VATILAFLPSRRGDDELRVGVCVDEDGHGCLVHDSGNHLCLDLGPRRRAVVDIRVAIVRRAAPSPVGIEVTVQVHTRVRGAGHVVLGHVGHVLAVHAIGRL